MANPGPRTEAALKIRGHSRDAPLSAANGALPAQPKTVAATVIEHSAA
jgi:hypothetical protein